MKKTRARGQGQSGFELCSLAKPGTESEWIYPPSAGMCVYVCVSVGEL